MKINSNNNWCRHFEMDKKSKWRKIRKNWNQTGRY